MTDPKINYIDLNEATPPEYRTTVLYGETGKRKTTTAARMVFNKGLYISADDSWIVLKKSVHSDLREKLDLVFYEGLSQIGYLNLNSGYYDHIILDTATAMVDRYLDLLYDKADWGGKYREKLVSNDPELRGTSTTAPIDYKVTRDKFRPVINKLVKAPLHVIMLMHENTPIEGLSKSMAKTPRMPGATWQIIKEQANIIGHMEERGKAGFVVNVDETSTAAVAKSQVEGISGKMDLDKFVQVYKETL